MTESAQKCENNEAIFKQNHKTLKRFIAFEMAYSCWFSLGRNIDFLQESFIT